MNENETPLTIGATEDTGKRPVKAKKKTPVKKAAPKKKPAPKKSGTKKTPKKVGKKPTTKPSASKKPGKSPAKVSRSGSKAGSSKPGKLIGGGSTSKTGSASVTSADLAVPTKTYGIARIDQPEKKNHGYYVRLGAKGNLRLKFFSDKKLGSAKKALAAATAFRDEQFALLPDKLKLRAAKPRKPYTKKAA